MRIVNGITLQRHHKPQHGCWSGNTAPRTFIYFCLSKDFKVLIIPINVMTCSRYYTLINPAVEWEVSGLTTACTTSKPIYLNLEYDVFAELSVWLSLFESSDTWTHHPHHPALTNAGVYSDSQLGPYNNAVLLPSGPDEDRIIQMISDDKIFFVSFVNNIDYREELLLS